MHLQSILVNIYAYIPVRAPVLVASKLALAVAIENNLLVKDGEAERGILGDFGGEVERVPLFSPVIFSFCSLLLFSLWGKQHFFTGVLDS